METVQLDSASDSRECRLCLLSEPEDDLIRPCSCSGSVRYTHRKCLDRWRTVSPHSDSLSTCEICKSQFYVIRKKESGTCWRRTKFGFAVFLDITFFLCIFFALWLGFGYVGDLAVNDLFGSEFPCNVTCNDYFQFTHLSSLWSGRIWFWGFIWFFFTLGCIGCFVFICLKCCGGEEDNSAQSSSDYYGRNDCYWICCGPSYYNGMYYGPYSYWGYNDILCCYLCSGGLSPHHSHSTVYGGNNCNCQGCDCKGGNCGGEGFLVMVAIVVIIFVVCGLIFGTILTFLVVNKIVKRHLYILERMHSVDHEMVADLDNPVQMSTAEQYTDFHPDQPLIANEVRTTKTSPKIIDDDL